MGDLKNPFWMHVKGLLFLLILVYCFGLVLVESPSLRIAALLLLLVWSSARFYYYCFYVIEKYIDDEFKFAGLFSVLMYLIKGSGSGQNRHAEDSLEEDSLERDSLEDGSLERGSLEHGSLEDELRDGDQTH